MRVRDLSRLLPGLYYSRSLCDLRAEVIGIERPSGGAWSRHMPPLDPETGEGQFFGALNRGKRSLTLNLKAEEGRSRIQSVTHVPEHLSPLSPVCTGEARGGGGG